MSPSKKNYDKDNDNYKNYKVNYIIDKDESDKKRVLDSVDTLKFFDDIEMEKIETELDGIVDDARMRKFKKHTVETTRLRLNIHNNETKFDCSRCEKCLREEGFDPRTGLSHPEAKVLRHLNTLALLSKYVIPLEF